MADHGFRGGNRYNGRGAYNNRYQGANPMMYGDGFANSYQAAGNFSNNDLLQLMSAVSGGFAPCPPAQVPLRMKCGDLRSVHSSLLVELTGRLVKKRVARFAELRDANGGACQLVILEEKHPRVMRRMSNMPDNTMLTIVGQVMRRPANSCNQTMLTGDVEVEVHNIVNLTFPLNTIKHGSEKRAYSTMATNNTNLTITTNERSIAKSANVLRYFENRKMTCNDLNSTYVGKTVSLVGWIAKTKNSKFLHIKDGYGQTQIFLEDRRLRDFVVAVPDNVVVQITGKVRRRPNESVNPKYRTGEIEVLVSAAQVINPKADETQDQPETSSSQAEPSETNLNAKGKAKAGRSNTGPPANVANTSKFTERTHTCGELNSSFINVNVVICGWLEFQRMGKFFVLRDGYGQTQVLLTEKTIGLDTYSDGISLESIIRVKGTVAARPENTVNPKMKTGSIEVVADEITVLNSAVRNLPFEIRNFNRANETKRLAYRYMDLRFPDMQRNLRLRSNVIMRMREYLINQLGFVEVETPTLFRRTPGGAQEFVVPTRKPGHFYSLVQSPQQFKQMLMAGAIDRYFQVARCYRDETTRPDRQPEFTQLDVELSFTTRADIMKLIEETLRHSWPEDLPELSTPFECITYREAIEKYGTDKPDTRFGLQLNNATEIIEKSGNFEDKYSDLSAYAVVARGQEALLNSAKRKHYEALGKEFNGTLFVRKFTSFEDMRTKLSKLLGDAAAEEFEKYFDLREQDLVFLAIGPKTATQSLCGRIRLDYHNFLMENTKTKCSSLKENRFLWVVDFPMFERNPLTNEIESVHHPFTAPDPKNLQRLRDGNEEDILSINSQAYDLVLNGQEVGGGSIRIHDKDLQLFVLEKILKIPHEHLAHLLTALECGCPPHGGIALGIDRLISIMCRTQSIRDVMAFPKSLHGRDPLSRAPVAISDEEKKLYHLATLDDAASDPDSDASLDEQLRKDTDKASSYSASSSSRAGDESDSESIQSSEESLKLQAVDDTDQFKRERQA